MLDDGQAQAGAADGFGVALIDAVKPLENALLVLLRNADARVPDRQHHAAVGFGHVHIHPSAGLIVLAGVGEEIAHHHADLARHAHHGGALAGDVHRHIVP